MRVTAKFLTQVIPRKDQGAARVFLLGIPQQVGRVANLGLHLFFAVPVIIIGNERDDHAGFITAGQFERSAVVVELIVVLPAHAIAPLAFRGVVPLRQAGGFFRHIHQVGCENHAAGVATSRFREDLFYRLNVIAVTAPPLRARREDIPLLVDHFLGVYCAKNNRPRLEAPREVLAVLCDYSWPGNVRELENVLAHACMMCEGDTLDIRDLPEHLSASEDNPRSSDEELLPMAEVHKRHAVRVLAAVHGNKAEAARILGLHRATLYRLIEEFDPEEIEAAGV